MGGNWQMIKMDGGKVKEIYCGEKVKAGGEMFVFLESGIFKERRRNQRTYREKPCGH